MSVKNSNEIKHKSSYGTVYKNGSFLAPNGKQFTRAEMKEIIAHYKGVNRIYKPFALLYYTDVMNGQASNWEEVST